MLFCFFLFLVQTNAEKKKKKKKKKQELYQQEEEHTRLNRLKLAHIHRQFMRGEKTKVLRNDVELLSQSHQREVDRKDAVIRILMDDLNESESQNCRSQQHHVEQVKHLVNLHENRLHRLEAEFERDLHTLKTEFDSERQEIVATHTRETNALRRIIHAVESEERTRAEEAKHTHETEREEIRNKNLEDINMLRINLENKIEDLERQFDEAHQRYVDQTDQANRNFKRLVKKDRQLNKQIDVQKQRIHRLQAKLSSWKKTMSQTETECKARNQALRAQKDTMHKHCQDLKLRMKKFRQAQMANLKDLSVNSREACLANQKNIELAERILRLAELCRKYETEKERVCPYMSTTDPLSDETPSTADAKHADSKTTVTSRASASKTENMSSTDTEHDKLAAWDCFDNLHKKFNKVLLDKLAIEKEKQRLQAENNDLRAVVKQYLDGLAVSSNALSGPNSLLIVNGRLNVLPEQVKQVRAKRPGAPDAVSGKLGGESFAIVGSQEASIIANKYASHSRPRV
jgi:dynein regulatory complex subunit 2